MSQEPPQVRHDPGLGWICSCTGIYVERVDFSLDCHHWPLCEHLVAAAKQAAAHDAESPQGSGQTCRLAEKSK